jgi:hypothetical protein
LKLPFKRGLRKRLRQRLKNPTGRTMPVFLVGCGRSGTSMLLHHLSRSGSVVSYNEDNEAAFEAYRLRPLDEIAALVDQTYARAAIFKPVLTTPHSREYLLRFPGARLIFVYRNFFDVVNSSVKRFGPADRLAHVNGWMDDNFGEFAPIAAPEPAKLAVRELWKPSLGPESAAAIYWLFHNRLYFDLDLHRDKRVKLIGYESLVANASSEMKAVCDFLHLGFEPDMVDGIRTTSVGRDAQPVLDGDIETACEALWGQLEAAHTKIRAGA